MTKKTKIIEKKNTGIRKKRNLAIFLTAVLATGLLAGGLLAKYRSDNQKQAEMISAQFHVSSDYLTEEGSSYDITDWQNGFEIQLYNYEKENTALISEDDITYEVSLSDTTKWKTGKLNGTIRKSSEKQSQSIKITPTSASAGESITVTVNITKPFTKTLKATFTLKGKSQPNYTITDNEDGSILVTIQSNSYSGDFTVNWKEEKYTPDNTNPLMTEWKNSSQTITVQKNTTYELLFFKKSVESINNTSGSGTTISLS